MKNILKNLRKLDYEPVSMEENDKRAVVFLSLMGIIFMGVAVLCATNLFTEVSENFLFQGIYFILAFCGIGIFPFLSLYCFWLAIKTYHEIYELENENDEN